MNRLIALAWLILLVASDSSARVALAQGRGSGLRPDLVEGAYEFVSEKVLLTESLGDLPPPDKRTGMRTSGEWEGQWLFADGRFSTIMMKKARPNFPEDLGYEATGGSYTVGKGSISLKNELMLSPFERMPYHDMKISLDGDTLTLVEMWHPFNPHSIYGGTRTIVLRRVRPNNGMQRTRK